MKAVCFSDSHHTGPKIDLWLLPEADFGIFSGDCCSKGDEAEYRYFIDWYTEQPVKHKLFVPGNHDWYTEREPAKARRIAESRGIVYLVNDSVELEGYKFFGTPVQPAFFDWAWNYEYPKVRDSYFSMIPDGLDVLITHCPPYGVLDMTPPGRWNNQQGENVGCPVLLSHVLRAKPRFHVFGHIHHCYGQLYKDGVHYVNASVCTEQYKMANQPIIVDLDEVYPKPTFEGVP